MHLYLRRHRRYDSSHQSLGHAASRRARSSCACLPPNSRHRPRCPLLFGHTNYHDVNFESKKARKLRPCSMRNDGSKHGQGTSAGNKSFIYRPLLLQEPVSKHLQTPSNSIHRKIDHGKHRRQYAFHRCLPSWPPGLGCSRSSREESQYPTTRP